MKKAGLVNSLALSKTIRAMRLGSGSMKPRSSPFGIAPSSVKSTEASPSGKGLTTSKDDLIEPVHALVDFAAKSVTSDLAAKVIGSFPVRALDNVASFASLIMVGSAMRKGYKLAQHEFFFNYLEIELDFIVTPLANIRETPVGDDAGSYSHKTQEEDKAAKEAFLGQKGAEDVDPSIEP
ncbi:hypothetical protein ACOSP7_024616 [Xanthoceras sorbifolium]